MSDEITISGSGPLISLMDQIDLFLKSRDPMIRTLIDIEKRIKELTATGKDYRGRRFAPYTDNYYEWKRKKLPGWTGTVNLKLSGNMISMINSQVISPIRGRVWVGAGSYPRGRARTDMIAQIHNTGTGIQKQREFMNVTDNYKKILANRHFNDPIKELARKWGIATGTRG